MAKVASYRGGTGSAELLKLFGRLTSLRRDVETAGQAAFARWRPAIKRACFLPSALNLAYYLALRRHDIRPLQAALTPWGLSSLGRLESRVLSNLDAVIATLAALCQTRPRRRGIPVRPPLAHFLQGERQLARNSVAVFGKFPSPRRAHIMVTLGTEAATDYTFVRELVRRGADCFRINCAHDGPREWNRMIRHIRRAGADEGRKCKVAMDLAGARPRTGDVWQAEPGRRLVAGDRVLLTRHGRSRQPEFVHQVECTLPEALDKLRVGSVVWFDEGRVEARVDAAIAEGTALRIASTPPKGGKLRAGQGLNFVQGAARLPALTAKDFADLDFVAARADIIGYSFVQESSDVALLQEELSKRRNHRPVPALMLKIETARAVHNLPDLIVRAGGRQPLAVMIARGDLAVEIGFERLAEIQEEILWLCEAAHVPVVWATQVLERLAKKGTPSRAEITDAAMGERAECVMLNKGPHVAEAVTMLDDVLTRMQAHQSKKTPQLRALRSWQHVVQPVGVPAGFSSWTKARRNENQPNFDSHSRAAH